jgi:hypothetical protein
MSESSFWAEAIAKAAGPARQLRPPTIPQDPAPSDQPDLTDYLNKAREAATVAQGVTADVRFSDTMEHVRPDGTKVTTAQRDSSDVFVRQAHRSWETNSRKISQDGLIGDSTPQEKAAAYQMALRDGRYSSVGAEPWARQAMLNDAIKQGVFSESGHGEGSYFDESRPDRV